MNIHSLTLLLIAAACTAISNLAMRAGLKHFGGFSLTIPKLLPQLAALLLDPLCATGIVFQALAAVIWFRVLSLVDVSVGYPVLVSMTFLLVTTGSLLIFGESVSWQKIFGLGVILAGIQLVARS